MNPNHNLEQCVLYVSPNTNDLWQKDQCLGNVGFHQESASRTFMRSEWCSLAKKKLVNALWSLLGRLRVIDTSEGNVHMLYLTQQGINYLAERAGLKLIRRKFFEFGLNQIV